MKVLVVGRSGQVARALARCAASNSLINLEALGRPDLDLVDAARVPSIIAAREPDIVINASAYTAVDKAESEPDRAYAINAIGAGAVAKGAEAAGAALLHLSTDYVFSGAKTTPYLEDDATGPITAYGVSKLAGEEMVLQAKPDAVIVRTAWVFDADGANFVRTMLRLATSRSQIGVVADQLGCPTYAHDLAAALLAIAGAAKDGASHAGVYHCVGAGDASWATVAEEIFSLSRARRGPAAAINRVSTSAYPTPARRPANSRLNCAKVARDFGVEMRPWQQALADCIDEIAASGWRVT